MLGEFAVLYPDPGDPIRSSFRGFSLIWIVQRPQVRSSDFQGFLTNLWDSIALSVAMSIVALFPIVQLRSSVTSALRKRNIQQYLAVVKISIVFSLIGHFISLSLHSFPNVAKFSSSTLPEGGSTDPLVELFNTASLSSLFGLWARTALVLVPYILSTFVFLFQIHASYSLESAIRNEYGRKVHQRFLPSILSGLKTYLRLTIPAYSLRFSYLPSHRLGRLFVPMGFTSRLDIVVMRVTVRLNLPVIDVPCFALSEPNKNTSLGDLRQIVTSMRGMNRVSFSKNVPWRIYQVEYGQPNLYLGGPGIRFRISSLENVSAMILKRSCQKGIARWDSFKKEGSPEYGRNDDEIQVLGFFLLVND